VFYYNNNNCISQTFILISST